MGRLDGKVALITGAGSGMGRMAAQAFVREGAKVVAADVNDKAVHETVANLDGQAVAVIALTKSLAVQFGPKGIRTNAICPGPIETPLMRDLLKDENKKRVRLNRIPMGRFGHAEDIVSLAIYLASDESSWTNGAALVVDGGITSNYF